MRFYAQTTIRKQVKFKIMNYRDEITINVNAAMAVTFAKLIELNFDKLVEYAKENIRLTDKGIEEMAHIVNELFEKSLKVALPE